MVEHPGYPTPLHLRPLMYWGRDVGQRPQDFVNVRTPAWAREALVFVLKNGVDAHPGIQAMGWADCRICGANLGSRDLMRFGYVWPEKAEHYLTVHDVWTPECGELLRAVLAARS